LSDLGDIPGTDDDGNEFELDITISQTEMAKTVSPIFQKLLLFSEFTEKKPSKR
jgi:molecular chaperone DnaK